MTAQQSRIERYLAHLDGLSGDREPEFWPVEASLPGHKGITAIGYRDLPEPGLFVGLTYGLSLARQDEWRFGRPELSICVRSSDPVWVLAIAHLAEQLRHDCPFSYGNTINFGAQIAEGSSLDGFVVFAPAALSKEDATVDVGDDLPVNIAGMYPTYRSEREYIAHRRTQGLLAARLGSLRHCPATSHLGVVDRTHLAAGRAGVVASSRRAAVLPDVCCK